MTSEIVTSSLSDTLRIAGILGRKLRGGEVIELVGDLGSGKTAFVRGLAKGIGSADQVQSPSFTIQRVYTGKQKLQLHHFDFHRLEEPGVVKQQLMEALAEPQSSIVIEWSDIVKEVLPKPRLQISFEVTGQQSRLLKLAASGSKHRTLLKGLK